MKLQTISTILVLATALSACSSNQVTQNPQSSSYRTINTQNSYNQPSSEFGAYLGRSILGYTLGAVIGVAVSRALN